jgi:hypothetical protein
MAWTNVLRLFTFLGYLGSIAVAWASPPPAVKTNNSQINTEKCHAAKRILQSSQCHHTPKSTSANCLELNPKFQALNFKCSEGPVRGDSATVTGPSHNPSERIDQRPPGNPAQIAPNPKEDNKTKSAPNQRPPSSDRVVRTDGQADALTKAGDTIGSGSQANGKLAADVTSGITTSRDFKMNQLESALASLEGIQQSFGGLTGMPPDVQSKFQQDQSLLNEFVQNTQENRPLDSAQARSANFPAVRTSLELAAAAAFLENEFTKEKEYLIQQGLVFASMHKQLAEAKSGLASDSLPPSLDGKIPADSEVTKRASAALVTKNSEISTITPQSPTPLAQENLGAKIPAKGSPAKMNIAELQKKLGEKLRDLKKTKSETESLTAFTGELGSGAVGDLTANPNSQDSDLDPLDSFKKTFSLEGIETDQEVRRIREESARELASSSGILLIDSKNLFERVFEYHRACTKRECVK